MAISVVMPALEMAQETGKLLAWRKKEGEKVAKGEPLLDIETDKAVVEIEAPGDGILAGIKAEEGAVVPVGRTIAWIVAPGEAPPADEAAAPWKPEAAVREAAQPAADRKQPAGKATAPKISPKARRLAQERGVDIRQLRGTGPDGAISTEDVMAAAGGKSAPAAAPAGGAVSRLMAERTTRSWTTAPHFFVMREIEAGALVQARERTVEPVERSSGVRPTIGDLLVALVARVLAKHPRINASWDVDRIRLNPEVNVGIAVAVEEGVIVPVIHGAAAASLAEIATQRRDLAERARTGRLRPADITGGTFTVSNLGMFDVDAFTAILVPPQAGILAVGRIRDRVVVEEGRPAVRPMMTLTLSTDHRVADGARAAEFLRDLAGAIREPGKWLSEE